MADDTEDQGNEGKESGFGHESADEGADFGALTGGESGLGNLPPLSDFDSVEESTSDDSSGLPPMDDLAGSSGGGGLPPIGDVEMETPKPRKTTPETPAGDFTDTPSFDTPSTDPDTPEPTEGLGFQDLAADSDFSPETPEIGPGPDSDIETPMFDSAFGGDSGEFASPGMATPTQAMETPMFDAESPGGGDFGFDKDAFSPAPEAPGVPGAEIGDSGGTPIPDFSPDTGVPQTGADAVEPVPVAAGRPARRGPSIVGIGVSVLLVVVAAAVGLFMGPRMSFIPNPVEDLVIEKEKEISTLDRTIRRLQDLDPGDDEAISQEDLERLITQYEDYSQRTETISTEMTRLQAETQQAMANRTLVMEDIEEKSSEFVAAQEMLEDLKNEMAITKARHEGLLAENERLSEMVGSLENANARRQATKDTLLHDLDLLLIEIEGGIPLTPQRFSRASRLAKAVSLRSKLAAAKWVDPALMNQYTELYLAEMDIAATREYFFAKIPVHDKLGTQRLKWSECLMNGNWSVFFRTIDGKHIGSYENMSGTNPPEFQFREDLPVNVQQDILDQIMAARVEGYEENIAVLEQKQAVFDNETNMQRVFSSL